MQNFYEYKEVESVQPVQMSIYQIPTEDLSWLHFNDEPRVQKRQQEKDQKSCISILVAYLTIPRSNYEHQLRHDNSIPSMAIW